MEPRIPEVPPPVAMAATPLAEPPLAEPPPEPAAPAERIEALDLLRGVAVLGILLVNIQVFAMPEAAFLDPVTYGDLTGANFAAWLAVHVLFEQKFLNIFAMLFGAGVLLVSERVAARGGRPAVIHYRRMLILGILGLLHAYGLWYGDVLFPYAVCGCVVYFCRSWKPWRQVLAGIILMAPPSLLLAGIGWSMPFWSEEDVAEFTRDLIPDMQQVAEEVAAYQGGWSSQMPYRARNAAYMHGLMLPIWAFWRVSGLMLIGMALLKWGVLAGERSQRFYLGLIVFGLAAGLPLAALGAARIVAVGFDPVQVMFGGMEYNYWGSVPMSLMYVAVVMLICQRAGPANSPTGLRRAVARLAAVGRMALSNYLLQTVICTTIFYGHGLGLFGRVERVEQLGIVIGVWIVCLAVSPWWLQRYRYGPAEWLWRALTYRRRPPISARGSYS